MNKHSICEEGKCTACFACYNKCPLQCISMGKNEIGNTIPVIDETRCIGCGACEKVCPVNVLPELSTPINTYAAYAKDEDIHIKAASGGVATVLSKGIIEDGGVVYGCAQSKGLTFEHVRVDNESELSKLCGSKYTHSHIGKMYSSVKDDLNNAKEVLFIGTPCQIAGLKNYLGNSNRESLYCIDLICHGVPDRNTFISAMQYECKIHDFENYSLSFRDSSGFVIKVRDKSGSVLFERNLKNSYYYNGFIEGYIYRHNCYSCRYATCNRLGDITLGDFWGLGKEEPFTGDKKNGINVLLVNSEKGSKLLNKYISGLEIWQRKLEEAVAGNGQLRAPVRYSKEAKKFEELCAKDSIQSALIKCNLSKRIAIEGRRIINSTKLLKHVLKRIPRIGSKI